MRLKTIVLILVGLVVLVIAGIAVFIATIDPNDYRAEIQQTVEDATGRKLTLGGDLSLGISLRPTIVARDIKLANASWGSKPDMLTADELDVQVALIPLINGDIHIIRFVLKGADILMEKNTDGVGNWQFGSGSSGAEASDKALLPSVDSIEVDDAKIAYVDMATGVHHDIELDAVSLSTEAPSAPLNVEIKATANGSPVSASGQVGSLDALMRSGSGPVDLKLDAFGVAMTLKGTVADVPSGGTVDLDVTLSADDLAKAAEAVGVTAPISGPVAFNGHIKGTTQKFELSGVSAEAGGMKTGGDLTVDLSGARPSLSGALTLDALDLTTLGGGASDSGGSSDKVFPSDPLPVDPLRLVDADVQVKIGTLTTAVMVAKDVVVPIKLSNGNLNIDPMTASVASSTINSTLGLDASGATPSLALKLTADKLDVGKMLKDAQVTDMLTGIGDLKIDVRGQGASIAAIMAALNGNASLLMEDGELDAGGLETLMGGTNALLGTMFESGTKAATMSCLAIAYDIKDGIADQKVFLIDTQYSVLVGQGSIDLGKETIDLLVSPKAKGVSLNVNVPVRIGGTLASPTVRPDEAALALKLGELVGGTLFPPALLLSLGDLGGGSDSGCVQANTGDGEGGALGAAEGAVEGATDAIGGAAESIGEGIENLFGD